MTDELHVVLGATGSTGRATITELLKLNKTIRGVNRSGKADISPAIEMVAVDAINDVKGLKQAVQGATVVYHCMGLPDYTYWHKNFIPMMQNVIDSATTNGSQTRVVFIDNLYMYGQISAQKGPLREDTPHLATGKKGKLRSKLNKMLLDAHNQKQINATIAQASDFYGPGCKNTILDLFVFPKVIKSKKVKMLANFDKKHAFAYIGDIAKSLVTLGLSSDAWGETWIVPHAKSLTLKEFILKSYEFARQSPQEPSSFPVFVPKIIGSLSTIIPLKPFKLLKEVNEVKYQFLNDWEVDDSKIKSKFGLEATPYEEGLKSTMDWYLANK